VGCSVAPGSVPGAPGGLLVGLLASGLLLGRRVRT
jgi:MYXO-CTERM domain-containing protein